MSYYVFELCNYVPIPLADSVKYLSFMFTTDLKDGIDMLTVMHLLN